MTQVVGDVLGGDPLGADAGGTADELLDVVTDVLAVVCGRPAARLTRDSVLAEIGADSLARVELAEQVEERLHPQAPALHIPDEDLAGFVTVGDVCDYLVARL